MSIQILSQKKKVEKTYKKKCKCGCHFSYTDSDVTHDDRDGGWYLFCPNCKGFILHKSEPRNFNIFGNRANDC